MTSFRFSSRVILWSTLVLVSSRHAQAQTSAMALVPPTDPAATNAPAMVSTMQGVHPRLLFTADEIAALKAKIPTDPILQKAYNDTAAWCKAFQVPNGPPDIITGGDTPAIWKSLGLFPGLAYIYALDHDPGTKQKIVELLTLMLAQPNWSPGDKETDHSMGAACNMEMVGLLFDAVYNDLDPGLRAKLVDKMFLHCRRMYYLGHKGLGPGIQYWQGDPQPNHRWYRDAGLGACLLAIADEKQIDAGYMLQSYKDEMDLVMKWYPPDGDCHEGAGYQAFGYLPIVTAASMTDRILGTTYLKDSGLKNAAAQQIYYWVPGWNGDISYGDDQNGGATAFGNNDAAFFFAPHLSRDKDLQAALVNRMTKKELPNKWGPFTFQWAMLAFYDPSVGQGDYKVLPLNKLFPDMGAATMRDSWEQDSVVFTFKCGPYGGYKLNEYRMANPVNGQPHYINIAHDDPDANEFALAVGDGFAFHPGVYSYVHKLTTQHNTLTVDDKGQLGEGDSFTQPTGTLDMRTLSYLTGWKTDDKGRAIIEGEAGNAYRGMTGPELKAARGIAPGPVLTKFRRTAIWLPGEYILVLDDIAGAAPHKYTWHANAPTATIGDSGHTTSTTETGKAIGFQILANQHFDTAAVPVVLDGRWGNVPVQQVQCSLTVPAVKFACVLDPWNKSPEMKMTEVSGTVTLTVHSANGDDTWTWQEAKDANTPSVITGTRSGAPLISLAEADKAPRG